MIEHDRLNSRQEAQPDSTEKLSTKTVAIKTDDLRAHLKKQISLRSSGCDKVFGRASEESILLNSYYASLTLNQNSPANVVLICGGSGLGKTKLAETLRVYAVEDDGFFIRVKFDQSSYGAASLPYSGIDNAFREYCSQLNTRSVDREIVVKALKKEFQKDEGSLLCEAIPSLRDVIEDRCDQVSSNRSESADDLASTKNRFHMLSYLVKKFIRVISSIGDPIIFLLDDMQVRFASACAATYLLLILRLVSSILYHLYVEKWSDTSSLDLVRVLASSAKNPFLFIFTYRPVTSDHPFLQLIKSLEERNRNNVEEITLNCLGRDDVNDMISNILGERICGNVRSLSDFLFRITHGSKSITPLV
jgi:predicted ATPase